MLDRLRTPFLIAALVLITLVFSIEVGASLADLLGAKSPPGLAIAYMAMLDGLLLFTMVLMGLALLMPASVLGRLQGLVSFLVSLVVLGVAIVSLLTALGMVVLMLSLFVAVPFGTLAYLAAFGHFQVGVASVLLGLLMLLKLGFAGCLVAAQQRFLQNKGLVTLILTSLVANVIVSFLHGFVPRILVSISDGIGAIVIAVIAMVWAFYFLIRSLPAITRAIH